VLVESDDPPSFLADVICSGKPAVGAKDTDRALHTTWKRAPSRRKSDQREDGTDFLDDVSSAKGRRFEGKRLVRAR